MKKKKGKIDLFNRFITKEQPKSPISEQYRTIRTNIEFSMVDQELKTLVCTSPNPSEGKSTTISNLAITFAAQGKKILFVDTDLRKPTLHKRFRVENRNGLTNVLTKHVKLEDSIAQTDVENLWLLPSGPIPPNPAEILGSNAMKEFVEVVKENFDLVIFDTPPILAFTDAQILGHLCDGALLIIKSNGTEKNELQRAKELLDKANVNILGVILNGVEKKEFSYYYYYGSY